MSKQTARIVREVHDEPHIVGSRITVRYIYGQVNTRGLSPETVADRHELDIADVYRALAYYHENPTEMEQVKKRHEQAGQIAREASDMTPPEE